MGRNHHLFRAASLALILILTGTALAAQNPVPAGPAPRADGQTAKNKSRRNKILLVVAITGAAAIGLALAAKRLNNEGVFARFSEPRGGAGTVANAPPKLGI